MASTTSDSEDSKSDIKVESTDWQLTCTELKQRGSALLQFKQFSDCRFAVGAGKEIFDAHKLMLAMASPVFEAMFYGSLAEKMTPVEIPDMEPEVFKPMLDYIYTDKMMITSTTHACQLYYGAQKYMMPHLMRVIRTYLINNLTPDNVCTIYEFAQMVAEQELIEESLKVIQFRTLEVLLSQGWAEASSGTFLGVLDMETLNVDTELQLYAAVERYALAHDPRALACDGQMDESTSLDSSEKLLELVRAGVHKIRFLTLTPKEVAEYKTLNSLLTESEILAIVLNVNSKETHFPMPEGFSTSRVSRKPKNMEMERHRPVTRSQVAIEVVVESASTFRRYDSRLCYICNIPWKIVVIKHAAALGVYIFRDRRQDDTGPAKGCRVKGECKLLSHLSDTKSFSKPFRALIEKGKTRCAPILNFISLNALMDRNNGYIENDELRLIVLLKVETLP